MRGWGRPSSCLFRFRFDLMQPCLIRQDWMIDLRAWLVLGFAWCWVAGYLSFFSAA
jgi:hypothetical protein